MKNKIFASLLLSFVCVSVLFAGGDIQKYKIGDLDFIAVKDISSNMSKDLVLNQNASSFKKFFADRNSVPASINAFLISDGSKNILIDAGLKDGGIVKNLKSAGIPPEKIDVVLLTHMHGDHIGGLLGADGGKVFKNAKVYVSKAEMDYWISRNDSLSLQVKKLYDKQIFYTDIIDNSLVQNVRAIPAPGHTPGHTVFEISSGADKILVIGDLLHIVDLQAADPSLSVRYDTDPVQAAKTREEILKYASNNNLKIAGMHIPFSGVGKFVKAKSPDKYKFIND